MTVIVISCLYSRYKSSNLLIDLELIYMSAKSKISSNIINQSLSPWIDEGFAQYFEKYPAGQSLNAVEYMPTIEDIVTFDRADFSKPDNPKYYKSSLYLLTFLNDNSKTKVLK